MAIDKVQRDLHQVHSWPLDTGIVVRLLAILLSITGILVSGIIRDFLHFRGLGSVPVHLGVDLSSPGIYAAL